MMREIGENHIYIYYIHPELRIGNCHSGAGKGAGPLKREY